MNPENTSREVCLLILICALKLVFEGQGMMELIIFFKNILLPLLIFKFLKGHNEF